MIQTSRHQFSNGLTLILAETHQAPVVSIQIGVRVGSRYEQDHEAGICHLIEHMLFKGTKRFGPGELAKVIEGSGGDVNAYTSFDETVYYATLSSRYLDRGLEILSDAVLNSVIDPTELDREREVVIEEILRGKDSPGKVLSENVFHKAYPHHHYGRPIIGFDKTVRGFSRKKVFDFYRRWYVPENMVVVIAGDFNTDQLFKRCQKRFGRLKATPSPKEKLKIEAPQRSPRALTLFRPVQGMSLCWAYHVPALEHRHIPALDILSHILGEGESSRLDMEVKEKLGLVTSIYSYVYTPAQPGLFLVSYSLPEKNVSQASRKIFNEIEKLKQQPVTHDELLRAKINIKSDAIYEKETVEGLAKKYGYFETILKQHDFDELYYQRIDNVTADDVLEVAQIYLQGRNLTLGLIAPQESSKKWQPKDLLSWIPKTKTKPKKTKKASQREIQHIRLKNGLRLILKPDHRMPTLTIRTAQLGGLRSETAKNNGINALLAQVWGKSSKNLNTQAMAREVELLAGSIDAYAGRNLTGMKADFLSEKIDSGLQLFLEAYLKPRFDKDEIVREKNNLLESIRRDKDALASQAFKLFMKELYPTHPYGRPLLGEAKSVRSLNRSALMQHYQKIMNPKQSVISIVGDFDQDVLMDKIGPSLESIPQQRNFLKNPKVDPEPKFHQRIEKKLEKFQAHIVYGFRGLRFSDSDRYALDVLNNILAGQGGRLFLELRDKMSLAYSVTSLSQEGIEPGYFSVYIATEGSKVEKAIGEIERELKKVLRQKVSKIEMERAKQYLVGAYEIDLQRNGTVATQLAFNEIYGMSRNEWQDLPQKILQVTPKGVAQVAKKILKLDRSVLAIVRPG